MSLLDARILPLKKNLLAEKENNHKPVSTNEQARGLPFDVGAIPTAGSPSGENHTPQDNKTLKEKSFSSSFSKPVENIQEVCDNCGRKVFDKHFHFNSIDNCYVCSKKKAEENQKEMGE
jgi:hypothetical protein